MPWGTFVLEWIHILLGIFWFGSALYANLILAPAMMRLSPGARRELFTLMLERGTFILTRVGYLTVAAGFLRGTVFGRIQSFDVLFSTRYGIVWLIALAVGLFLALWSHLVLVRSARQMIAAMDQTAAMRPTMAMAPTTAMPDATGRHAQTMVPRMIEFAGFFVLFTLMIVLKFS